MTQLQRLYASAVAPSSSVAADAIAAAPPSGNEIEAAAHLIVQIVLAVTALIALFKRPTR